MENFGDTKSANVQMSPLTRRKLSLKFGSSSSIDDAGTEDIGN